MKLSMSRPALLIMFAVIFHSCRDTVTSPYINEEASVSIPGLPFNIEKGIFLNQYTNPSTRTTSWILGDSSFLKVSKRNKLCILHWSQTDDPVWIGARIPGRFLWADVLQYQCDSLNIKQYHTNGSVVIANEAYKKEVESVLKEILKSPP